MRQFTNIRESANRTFSGTCDWHNINEPLHEAQRGRRRDNRGNEAGRDCRNEFHTRDNYSDACAVVKSDAACCLRMQRRGPQLVHDGIQEGVHVGAKRRGAGGAHHDGGRGADGGGDNIDAG